MNFLRCSSVWLLELVRFDGKCVVLDILVDDFMVVYKVLMLLVLFSLVSWNVVEVFGFGLIFNVMVVVIVSVLKDLYNVWGRL